MFLIKYCSEACFEAKALYFALYKGVKCVCGYSESFLAMDKPAGDCDKPCGGDDSLSCGGKDAYSLYEVSGYAHS